MSAPLFGSGFSPLPPPLGGGGAARGGWMPRVAAWLAWALAGYVGAFWALQWGEAEQADGPSAPVAASVAEVDVAAVARALGAGGEAPVSEAPATVAAEGAPPRVALVGVLAASASAQGGGERRGAAAPGVALLAVDGQRPQLFAVGSVVAGQWVLARVLPQAVELVPRGMPSAAPWRLDLPQPHAGGPSVAPATAGGAEAGGVFRP